MLDSENPEESDIKLVISIGSQAKQQNSRKTSTCLTMQKPLPVCITGNCKIIKEMGIPDHLTRLLRNRCTGQEATVRSGKGTTDRFKIGTRVH